MARKRRSRVGGQNTALGQGQAAKPITPQNPLQPQNPYVSETPPPDPGFEAYRVNAQRNTALADADAAYQTQRLDNSYGLGVDQSNPFNMAKMLRESWLRDQNNTTTSYASRGLRNSGAYKQVQAENERQYNVGYDQLARDYQDAQYGITRGQLQSYAGNALGVDDENFRRLLRALTG